MTAELIALLRPSSFFRVISGAQVLSVVTDAPGPLSRKIRATGAGTINVKDAGGASVAIVTLEGEHHDVAISEIVSLSGTTAVTVYW